MATTTQDLAANKSFEGVRRKVQSHLTQNEALVFEKSSPGKKAYKMPPLDVPVVDPQALLGEAARADLGLMPELSEIEIIRHFTRLSTWNYAIDLGMYPLGSCTMKYNPRVNEFVARLEGIAEAHPYQPESLSQGALEVILCSSVPAGHYRHGHHYTAAGCGGAWGIHRDPVGAGVSPVPGKPAAQDHHSRFSPRHQPGHGRHLRLPGGEPAIEFAGHGRCGPAGSGWSPRTQQR